MLEDEKERKKCLEVVEEARERVEKMVSSSSIIFLHSFVSLPFFWYFITYFQSKKQGLFFFYKIWKD
jgi:ABC-type glycerol-3-phosphate transport system permease component